MWSPRLSKSTGRIHTTTSRPTNFSCSSFKDIQSLCKEEPETPKKPSIFHRVRVATSILRNWTHPTTTTTTTTTTNQKIGIVIYFTSLRIVRKTFEDCKTVRSILRSFRVKIDERDLSMDLGFLKELEGIIGKKEKLSLPRVFIGGRYIGGAEEIRALHENGELKKIVDGLPVDEIGVCDNCGGYRFLLCDQCDGSHKLFMEKGGGFRSCFVCNENGLIRCPSCSSSVVS